jgi:prepilin-type processing-associated H-X9-DG protein
VVGFVVGELSGYYSTVQVGIVLAYMALCRIKCVERLRYESPGELGKLLGLDRVPEVRCLHQKLTALSQGNAPERWAGLLSRDWLEGDPDLAGMLYVDGHVRLYHGHQPRCRAATCRANGYVFMPRRLLGERWFGPAFFVIERPVDHGLLEALRSDIVPRWLNDIAHQPTEEELKADPYRFRFLMVFDREGYSPGFFKEMWQTHRIACITYHIYPKPPWPLFLARRLACYISHRAGAAENDRADVDGRGERHRTERRGAFGFWRSGDRRLYPL